MSREERLFNQALSLPKEEREHFLFDAAEGSWEVFTSVMELLAYHEQGSFLDEPPETVIDLLESESASGLDPGARLSAGGGQYEIECLAGMGGSSTVYVVNQFHPLRRKAALKLLHLRPRSSRAQRRFAWELQALGMLRHPAIPKLYATGELEDGRVFLLMELVEGEPLTRFCRDRKLSLRERLRLVAEVAYGVQHAHDQGVVHRDLKPANILVGNGGAEPTPKIVDFGAVALGDAADASASEAADESMPMGSPRYMSPEQLGSGEPVSTASDIYALGVILYELISGIHPLDVDGSVETLTEIRNRVLYEDTPNLMPSQSQATSEKPDKDLQAMVGKAMARTPRKRYASAGDLGDDIMRYIQHNPVVARPASTTHRMRLGARRHPVLTRFSLLLGVLMSLALAINLNVLASTKDTLRQSEVQREDLRRLSDMKLLDLLREEADLLPATAQYKRALQDWLQHANALGSRLDQHRKKRSELLFLHGTESSSGEPQFENSGHAFQYRVLDALIKELNAFTSPNPHLGNIAEVQQRVERSQVAHRICIEEGEAAWEKARTAIAASPLYEGILLPVQAGLLPLGPDPESGLWEFAHPYTGAVPERDPQGRLVVTKETGLVFVLIPGGTFYMGATREEGDHSIAQYGDTLAVGDESPIHVVNLPAFFISKFEMNQAQWLRATGDAPSMFPKKPPCFAPWTPELHPAENISWGEASRVMSILDLALPSEAQWEYAARGGTTGPHWTGRDWWDMEGGENVDDVCRRLAEGGVAGSASWNDGFGETSPVGQFRANPFGLHDVLGNVFEWCQDLYGSYELPIDPETGERQVGKSPERVARGSDFRHTAEASRVSWRVNLSPVSRTRIGVRPAQAIKFDSTS